MMQRIKEELSDDLLRRRLILQGVIVDSLEVKNPGEASFRAVGDAEGDPALDLGGVALEEDESSAEPDAEPQTETEKNKPVPAYEQFASVEYWSDRHGAWILAVCLGGNYGAYDVRLHGNQLRYQVPPERLREPLRVGERVDYGEVAVDSELVSWSPAEIIAGRSRFMALTIMMLKHDDLGVRRKRNHVPVKFLRRNFKVGMKVEVYDVMSAKWSRGVVESVGAAINEVGAVEATIAEMLADPNEFADLEGFLSDDATEMHTEYTDSENRTDPGSPDVPPPGRPSVLHNVTGTRSSHSSPHSSPKEAHRGGHVKPDFDLDKAAESAELKLKYTDISVPVLVALDDAGTVWVRSLLVRQADVERPSPRASPDVPHGAAASLRSLAHLPSEMLSNKLLKKHRGQQAPTPPGGSSWPQWPARERVQLQKPSDSSTALRRQANLRESTVSPQMPPSLDTPAPMPQTKEEDVLPQEVRRLPPAAGEPDPFLIPKMHTEEESVSQSTPSGLPVPAQVEEERPQLSPASSTPGVFVSPLWNPEEQTNVPAGAGAFGAEESLLVHGEPSPEPTQSSLPAPSGSRKLFSIDSPRGEVAPPGSRKLFSIDSPRPEIWVGDPHPAPPRYLPLQPQPALAQQSLPAPPQGSGEPLPAFPEPQTQPSAGVKKYASI